MNTPTYAAHLASAYGAPSQAAFGSAVFFEILEPGADLDAAALRWYEYFLGSSWSAAYRQAWVKVYERAAGAPREVERELRALSGPLAQSSATMVLDAVDGAADARRSLSEAFDDAATRELVVHSIGDGGAMSGLVVAGRRENGESTFLVFLMD